MNRCQNWIKNKMGIGTQPKSQETVVAYGTSAAPQVNVMEPERFEPSTRMGETRSRTKPDFIDIKEVVSDPEAFKNVLSKSKFGRNYLQLRSGPVASCTDSERSSHLDEFYLGGVFTHNNPFSDPSVPINEKYPLTETESHDARVFVELFSEAVASPPEIRSGKLKSLRIAIQCQTVQIARGCKYMTAQEIYVLERIESNVIKIDIGCQFTPEKYIMPADLPFRITVHNDDCLVVNGQLKKRNYRPCVLNLANDRKPGGGWQTGCGAQEENLFRRSNYCEVLNNEKLYPLYEACVHTSNVQVFRGTESTGYPLQRPELVDFVAAAAHRKPQLSGLCGFPNQDCFSMLKRVIDNILSAAEAGGNDAIVLGALGCGAFGNPPEVVAAVFWERLHAGHHTNFKHIAFAIHDDHNSYKAHNVLGNHVPFKVMFEPREATVILNEHPCFGWLCGQALRFAGVRDIPPMFNVEVQEGCQCKIHRGIRERVEHPDISRGH